MDAIARILGARTHFDVLELERSAATEPAAVRRKYKTLAMQVHPDKNRGEGAEEAFKRLSQAYECLVDAQTHRVYLAELARGKRPHCRPAPPPPRAQPSTASRPPPPWPPKKPKKRKTPPPPPPPRAPGADTPQPRRWRTPEEIWAQFQREEEEQARREFQSKGFERDYEKGDGITTGKSAWRRTAEDAAAPRDATAHSVDQEAVETNAREWTAWKRARVGKDTGEVAVPGPGVVQPSTPTVVCCLICRRKFPTEAALVRHEQLSALHKQNLQLNHENQLSAASAVSS